MVVLISLDYITPRPLEDTPQPQRPRTTPTIPLTYVIKSSAERPDFGMRLTYICLTLNLPT